MRTNDTAILGAQFLRFLVLGVAKTAATGALLYGLTALLPARVAFTIVYAASLVVVALVTPRFVFRLRASRARIAMLLGWYGVVYGVGVAVVSALDTLTESRLLLSFGTVCVTAPLGFVGACLILWPGVSGLLLEEKVAEP